MYYALHTLWSVAASVLGVASSALPDPNFTFTVPVRVANLPPDSRTGLVSCSLHTGPIGTRGAGGTVGFGNGFGTFAISGGAYEGEVTVTANAIPGVDPATITHYSCGLSFVATVRGRDQQFAYYLSAARGPALPVAPGPQTPRVDGAIR